VETKEIHRWDDFNNDIPAIDQPLVFWFENRWITVDLGQENYDKYHQMLHNLAAHGRKLEKAPVQRRHHNRTYKPPASKAGRDPDSILSKGPVTISGGAGGVGMPKAATVTAKPRAGRSTAPANVAKRAKRFTMTKEERRKITAFAEQVMGVTVKPNGRINKEVMDRYTAAQHTNGTANGSRPAVPTTPATTGVK
jgi:hypothetical protein